jgi:hypothetical protein
MTLGIDQGPLISILGSRTRDEILLSVREWTCAIAMLRDRNVNAARNINSGWLARVHTSGRVTRAICLQRPMKQKAERREPLERIDPDGPSRWSIRARKS